MNFKTHFSAYIVCSLLLATSFSAKAQVEGDEFNYSQIVKPTLDETCVVYTKGGVKYINPKPSITIKFPRPVCLASENNPKNNPLTKDALKAEMQVEGTCVYNQSKFDVPNPEGKPRRVEAAMTADDLVIGNFHINYDGFDGSDISLEPVEENLANIDYVYNDGAALQPVASADEYLYYVANPTSITFIIRDMVYLKPLSKFKVILPELKYAADETGNSLLSDLSARTFEFTITPVDYVWSDDYDKQLSTRALTEDEKTVVVQEGKRLRIATGDHVYCSQLIVEGRAGVEIEEGGTLTVADTAYFLSPTNESWENAYLINNGTFESASSVFVRESLGKTSDCWYVHQASPVKSVHWSDMHFSGMADDCFLMSPMSDRVKENYDKPDGSEFENYDHWYYDYDEYMLVENTLNDYYRVFADWRNDISNFAIRYKGEVNDEASYAYDRYRYYYHVLDSYWNVNRLDNPYPAPIDWRSVVEANRTGDGVSTGRDKANHKFVNNVINTTMFGHHNGAVYNTFSGLTTYDGPMQYGYLTPSMMSSQHTNNIYASATFKKEDLCSYQDITEKYNSNNLSEYPYIRFVVEDEAHPTSAGYRSVCVVYFISSDDDKELYKNTVSLPNSKTTGEDKKYKGSYKLDANFESEFYDPTYTVPYIFCRPTNGDATYETFTYKTDAYYMIKSYPFPTMAQFDEESGDIIADQVDTEVTLSILTDSERAKVKILDYNMKGMKLVQTVTTQQMLKGGARTVQCSGEYVITGTKYTADSPIEEKYKRGDVTFKFEADPNEMGGLKIVDPLADPEYLAMKEAIEEDARANEDQKVDDEDDDPTAVKIVVAESSLRAAVASNGSIRLINTTEGATYTLYDMNGRVLHSAVAGVSDLRFPAVVAGIYFAKGNNQSVKVVVR
ncbi:MAG: T9SS type A sorting domain-containing protein [Marinilabiliaceae bacterium]|nr:T9SS type A sorting domain-containing protein [Marinilabiliaceae bacterium]